MTPKAKIAPLQTTSPPLTHPTPDRKCLDDLAASMDSLDNDTLRKGLSDALDYIKHLEQDLKNSRLEANHHLFQLRILTIESDQRLQRESVERKLQNQQMKTLLRKGQAMQFKMKQSESGYKRRIAEFLAAPVIPKSEALDHLGRIATERLAKSRKKSSSSMANLGSPFAFSPRRRANPSGDSRMR
ncbi:hypothetical protein NEOLI_000069 [Neolecta irregularis DAH-3]|uniref:Uncharacterized protein n=1 Tax=Neolecta irregularis (strain DAH-3) TaxID=1198029 RepID=A0A1U7LVD1_NEOID|nr:hypothetical protein NEOLI_000069 [Neolecta irregularis DAH-3]|eukprot:OLL26617.1 hypothetical protein NEOLI_000069 [Neolecta irregularis DAH-3]